MSNPLMIILSVIILITGPIVLYLYFAKKTSGKLTTYYRYFILVYSILVVTTYFILRGSR